MNEDIWYNVAIHEIGEILAPYFVYIYWLVFTAAPKLSISPYGGGGFLEHIFNLFCFPWPRSA